MISELTPTTCGPLRPRARPGGVVTKHVLRNAMIPVITVVALSLPNLLAGAVVIETVFAWPGMGRMAIYAVIGRDYPVIIGFALVVPCSCCSRTSSPTCCTRSSTRGCACDDRPRSTSASWRVARRADGDSPLPDTARGRRDWSCWYSRARFVFAGPLRTRPDQGGSVAVRQPPSAEHWLGTDGSGRDVLRQAAARRPGVAARRVRPPALLACTIGTVLGAVAGIVGGWVDSAIMRAADIFLSFPSIVVLIVVSRILGSSVTTMVLAFGVFTWPTSGRVVRGMTLSLREREFIQAARGFGARIPWLVTRHVVPAVLGSVVVVATLAVATGILLEASLSFLGLGVQPPQPSWGTCSPRPSGSR